MGNFLGSQRRREKCVKAGQANGGFIPFVAVTAAVSGVDGQFSLYGLEANGSVFSPIALIVVALFITHGFAAYSLLFAKSWGVNICIVLA